MPKKLLPIIQYAAEEAIAAGITELVFVTGRAKLAMEDHFNVNPELERKLVQTARLGLKNKARSK
jgi:UTP--glucose-1-phosphate uridylyltransferase